jgi:carbon storage regulator
MLVLKRKTNERIFIGDDITICVVEIREGDVRIGIEAPRGMSILREEVYDRIAAEQVVNPGDVVEYCYSNLGDPVDSELCHRHLEHGKKYRVAAVTRAATYTTYKLEGFGEQFNSVNFEKVVS